MKLLIVSPILPYPLTTGGAQAVFNMITELQQNVEIHYLYPYKKGDEKSLNEIKKHYWQNVNIYPFKQKRDWKFYLSRLCISYNSRYIYKGSSLNWLESASQFFTAEFIDEISKTIERVEPDIIQTEFYNNIELGYFLPDNIKKVFIQHEIHYVVNEQQLVQGGSNIARLKLKKLKVEEIAAMNSYDAVVTLTEADSMKLKSDGVSTKLYFSPAGIAPPIERNKCSFKSKLIFVGGSGHFPNVEGLNWFLTNIWQNILKEHPSIELSIVGAWDSSLAAEINKQYNNVSFLGFVPAIEPIYDGTITIVPILSGSGMRMKIIDAVNIGSPFISTSIGNEGLMYKDGDDCFIADTPDEFTQKLLLLIESDDIRERFYKNSVVTRDKYYSMQTLAQKRLSIYRELLNDKSNR